MDTLTTGQAAVAGGIVGSMIMGVLVFYVLTVIAGWKIFTKAGIAGWKSLIPIYNEYLLFKLSGIKKWFWILLVVSIIFAIICAVSGYNPYASQAELDAYDYGAHPLLGIGAFVLCIIAIIAEIMLAYKLAKAFNKGIGFTIGLIFLPNIFQLILGFGSAKYDKKVLKSQA